MAANEEFATEVSRLYEEEERGNQERQRLEDIERQEAENLSGQRNLEHEAITRLLEARGLTLHQIPSDGDCMFAGQLLNSYGLYCLERIFMQKTERWYAAWTQKRHLSLTS